MKQSSSRDRADRLCRPLRVGLFGHRGVGKTTLLAMLYREAAGGRLPGLRLAAADPATARHLADKIAQLEAGQTLPATLDETQLRFHLYHQGSRVELVVLDYQGEHVALGKNEPIRDFLRDCDAVLFCLDAPVSEPSAARWQAEQEVEQVVEDYLATERAGESHRPMALLVTKADLLAGRAEESQRLDLTRHALTTHCPWSQTFAVSSTGGGPKLKPAGLDAPLAWLAESLREQDRARLEHLWQTAPRDHGALGRATAAFARRHPQDASTPTFRGRLAAARGKLLLRRLSVAAVALFALAVGVWCYDTWDEPRPDDDPARMRQAVHDYQTWHPTRRFTRPAAYRRESDTLADLDRLVRDLDRQRRYSELRRRADDPDADVEAVWADFLRFKGDFSDHDLDEEGTYLRARVKEANDRRRDHKAQLALRSLAQAETSGELPALAERAGKLAREHAGSSAEAELLRRQAAYLGRIDERDFEAARDYSTRSPHNFFTRKEKYQQYLDRHPSGAQVPRARAALTEVSRNWDRHDYRSVRDLYAEAPSDIKEIRARSRAYLSAHPAGKFRDGVGELLRWCDKVSEYHDYTVTLVSGSFSKDIAHMISRGASLSVEIEVNGVRHGPSTIVRRNYQPEWDYEFPRPVRWKAGDSVRIVVTDNYYWNRRVADVTFDDVLAMSRLSGEVEVSYGSLTFASDFAMPKLPRAEE